MSYFELFTDGSHLQDWDIAGIGGYLLNPKGKKVWSFSEKVTDPLLNSKHEILALEAGLLRCIADKVTHLKCYTDLNSLSKILNLTDKKDLEHFISRNTALVKIVSLIPYFENISFEYIPRTKNYKADILSKKFILKETKHRNKLVDNYIKIPKFICAEQYPKNRRFYFFNQHKSVNHYYLFSLKSLNILEIYEVEKGVRFNKLGTHVLHRESEPDFLELICQTIETSPYQEIGIMIKQAGSSVDKKLRGIKSLEPDEVEIMQKFKTIIQKFDKVILNYSEEIAHAVFPMGMKDINEGQLIENIKLLGECDFVEDEPYIANLQKKELGEFINLMIHHEKELHKQSPSDSLVDIKTIIAKAHEKLQSEGINLKSNS